MDLYYILMIAMAVIGVIVFIALFYLKAGYGYLSSSNWGPKISNKIAWVLMEAPSFFFMLWYTLRYAFSDYPGKASGNSNLVLYVIAGLFLLHSFPR